MAAGVIKAGYGNGWIERQGRTALAWNADYDGGYQPEFSAIPEAKSGMTVKVHYAPYHRHQNKKTCTKYDVSSPQLEGYQANDPQWLMENLFDLAHPASQQNGVKDVVVTLPLGAREEGALRLIIQSKDMFNQFYRKDVRNIMGMFLKANAP